MPPDRSNRQTRRADWPGDHGRQSSFATNDLDTCFLTPPEVSVMAGAGRSQGQLPHNDLAAFSSDQTYRAVEDGLLFPHNLAGPPFGGHDSNNTFGTTYDPFSPAHDLDVHASYGYATPELSNRHVAPLAPGVSNVSSAPTSDLISTTSLGTTLRHEASAFDSYYGTAPSFYPGMGLQGRPGIADAPPAPTDYRQHVYSTHMPGGESHLPGMPYVFNSTFSQTADYAPPPSTRSSDIASFRIPDHGPSTSARAPPSHYHATQHGDGYPLIPTAAYPPAQPIIDTHAQQQLSLTGPSFTPPPYESSSARAFCRWNGACGLPLDDVTPAGLARHLREVHFARGAWSNTHRGPCRFAGESGLACGRAMDYASFGKHIASVHLKSTSRVCEDCGKEFGRADSLARHKKSSHGVSAPEAVALR